jgi:hypothetical protein
MEKEFKHDLGRLGKPTRRNGSGMGKASPHVAKKDFGLLVVSHSFDHFGPISNDEELTLAQEKRRRTFAKFSRKGKF